MQVTIDYQQGLQFQATARSHRLLGDQPLDNGGSDQGMTPPEWFLASLGSCIGFYLVKYLQARQLDASGLQVQVSAQKAQDAPARLDDLQVSIHYPHGLEERHHQGLRRAADACLIHNTLTHPPRLNVQVFTPVSL